MAAQFAITRATRVAAHLQNGTPFTIAPLNGVASASAVIAKDIQTMSCRERCRQLPVTTQLAPQAKERDALQSFDPFIEILLWKP